MIKDYIDLVGDDTDTHTTTTDKDEEGGPTWTIRALVDYTLEQVRTLPSSYSFNATDF